LSQTRGRIFIGGGIGNLLIALWLYESGRMSRDELPITIFESEEDVGGLFRSYSYPDGSVFDSGMHVFYETLDRELDSTWWSLLPNEEWNVLEGNRKDIAGVSIRIILEAPKLLIFSSNGCPNAWFSWATARRRRHLCAPLF
jgi:hypothetical protein